MRVRYFADTDTMLIEFRDSAVVETRDLDASGNICSITVEHASIRADAPKFSYEQVAA